MTLAQIKENGLYQPPGVAEAANNAELENGEGRIIARYKQARALEDDIYIQAYFSENNPGLEYNNTMILYRREY